MQEPLTAHIPSCSSERTQVAYGELDFSYPFRQEYATTAPKARDAGSPGFALDIVGSSIGQKPSFAANLN